MLPTRGLFLLVRLTDKISTCTASDKVGWKLSTDLRVITIFQQAKTVALLTQPNASKSSFYLKFSPLVQSLIILSLRGGCVNILVFNG